MSQMQLRSRTTLTTRRALNTVDENASVATNNLNNAKKVSTRGLSRTSASTNTTAKSTNIRSSSNAILGSKMNVQAGSKQTVSNARTALGDLSNKYPGANAGKVTKPSQKGSRSGPNSQKKKTAIKSMTENTKETTTATTKLNALKENVPAAATATTAAAVPKKSKKVLMTSALEEETLIKSQSNVVDDKVPAQSEDKKVPTLSSPYKENKDYIALRTKQVAAAYDVMKMLAQKEKPDVEDESEPAQYWDDLDAADANDHLMVSEYVVDIFKYMGDLEKQTMPIEDYIKDQRELSWKMRSILVDWLIEVHNKFRLLPETLYLAINLMDRFLSFRTVSLVKLQLVGITALFVASKYEEVIHPSVKNFLFMADNGYTEDEIFKAERYLLQVLNFSLQYPNPMNFLRRISKAEDYDIQTRTLGKYLMEITLVDHRFIKYPPSMIAAAAAWLSRTMLHRFPVWNNNLKYYSGGYSEQEIKPVVDLMKDYLSKPVKYDAVYKKYCSKKFMKSAIFVKDWIERTYHVAYEDGHFSDNTLVEHDNPEPSDEDSSDE